MISTATAAVKAAVMEPRVPSRKPNAASSVMMTGTKTP